MTIAIAEDAEDNGLAAMLAGLVEQNLLDRPDKRRDFERLDARIAIVAEDAGVSLTLLFERGKLQVEDGIVGIPDLTVRAASDDIVQMSLIELGPLGLPNVRGAETRKVLAASRSGRIHIYGALAHPLVALRLTRLLSIN